MNSDVQIFSNQEFGDIRTLIDEATGEPLFCGSDVCKALGYKKPQNAIATHVDTPYALKRGIGVITGKRADGTPIMQQIEITFVREPGLYSLIFSSHLPSAKKFTRWVTSEVLPSIRKTGRYALQDQHETKEPMTTGELIAFARALVAEHEGRLAAESVAARQQSYIATLEAQLGTVHQEQSEPPDAVSVSDKKWLGEDFIGYMDEFFTRDNVWGIPIDIDTLKADAEVTCSTKHFKQRVIYYSKKRGVQVNPRQLFYHKDGREVKKALETNYFAHQAWRLKDGEDGQRQRTFERTERALCFYRRGDPVPADHEDLMKQYNRFVSMNGI